MPNLEENQPTEITGSPLPAQTATVVSNHEGEDGMGSRSMTMGRYEEIRRRLAEGRGLREIARALNCSRDTVREVRDGARQSPDAPKPLSDPLWMLQLDWPAIVHDLGLGHPLKFNSAMHNFLRGHVAAFSHFNGVPRVCLYDNLKSAVLERRGEAIHFHPQLLELAAYYRYQPRPVAPARGNEKGRVEKAIRFIRDRFFAARQFRDLDDLNAQALTWACGEAANRPCPEDRARSVRAVFMEEQPRLLALPLDLFPTEERVALSSKKAPYLRFGLNDYSFPHSLVGRTLELVPTLSTVRIFDGTTLVAEHVRNFDEGQQIEDPRHIEEPVAEKRSAREHRAFDRLHHAAASSAAFFKLAAEHGVHLGVLTRGLLELLDVHGAAALKRAMAAALAEKSAHLGAVRHFIDLHQREGGTAPPIAVRLPDDPRLRDITVRTHDLRDYEKFSGGGKP